MLGIRYSAPQSWGTDFVSTLAAGTAFVNLNDQVADTVILYIPASAGVDILCAGQVQEPTKFVSSSGFTVPLEFHLTGNTNEILVRRTDLSATPLVVRYAWVKFRR